MASKPNPKRTGRSLQRLMALEVLYEADLREIPVAEMLSQRRLLSTHEVPIGEYGSQIVSTYADSSIDVDSMVEAGADNWRLYRMGVVDRNLLRIGATEIMFFDVDLPVVVSEVKSLAIDLGLERRVGYFIGILNRVAEMRAKETEGLKKPVPDEGETAQPDPEVVKMLDEGTK